MRGTDDHEAAVGAQVVDAVGDGDADDGQAAPGELRAAAAATTLEEQERILKEAVMYHAEQHLQVWGPEPPQFNVNQPWLKGYNGEINLGNMNFTFLARLWIDRDLKREMGF